MTRDKHRASVPDRARRRAIRAHAARLGVPYSVAARLLRAQFARRPDGPIAEATATTDEHRAWLSAAREHRRFAVRVSDTRQAADLPLGRARHLTERFPAMRGPVPLYCGDDRTSVLGVLYAVIAVESPEVLPSPAELAWVAELGEEEAVDIACAAPDRAARLLLDGDRWRLWTRVEAALATAAAGTDWRMRDVARTLDPEFRTVVLRHSVDGARQTLDAVLAGSHTGFPPGTRVRAGATVATVTGARWTTTGPPTAYEIRSDAGAAVAVVDPGDVDALEAEALPGR